MVAGQWLRLLFQRPPLPQPQGGGHPGWSAWAHRDLSPCFLTLRCADPEPGAPRAAGPGRTQSCDQTPWAGAAAAQPEDTGVTNSSSSRCLDEAAPGRTTQFSAKPVIPGIREDAGVGGLLGALACAPLSALREGGPSAGVRQRLGAGSWGDPSPAQSGPGLGTDKAGHRQTSTRSRRPDGSPSVCAFSTPPSVPRHVFFNRKRHRRVLGGRLGTPAL